ncbi:MAG TPA: AAA family ATPase [Gemmatimonadota bacterium]|nr:AAA family ATPase [Gemmatimonadota bacterium]
MICPQCQGAAAPGARFCPDCGAALPVAAPRQDETRLVTVLFADMSGSVATTQDLDPEAALERVSEALDVMSRAVLAHGGRVDRYLGDGILALFGVPRANEDDPLRAIAAAIKMRDEARGRGFAITAGINTGEAYVGRVGSDAHRELTAMGPAVNLAARLQGRCEPGEVLVGETTWRIARRAFEFEPRETRIKGLAEPVKAWVALTARARSELARGLEGLRATLVGRAEEVDRLSQALASARAGSGHTVSVVGEAGVGKSRLVAEIKRMALDAEDGDDAPLWLEGRCLESTTSTSYAPFVDLLRERFLPGAGLAARVEPVAAELDFLVRMRALPADRVEDVLVPLVNLLSIPDSRAAAFGELPPQQVKTRTFLAITHYLSAMAAWRPVVVALDDLHWADSLTLELVPRLATALGASRALLLCVQRPAQEHGSRHLIPLLERHTGGRHVDLRLRPLDAAEGRRLVLSLLDVDDFPDTALDAILEKAQGNPLFLEEVLRSLLTADQIARENGGIKVSDRLRFDDVPATVQSIIQSRVDRIDEEPRRVLQTAAVIGRLFGRVMLERMIAPGLDVERALWHLEQHDLVYLDRVMPEEEYSFKHVFTRDTVYRSLLKRRKSELHHAAGQAIEWLYADRLEEHLEQLAYHYDRTNDAGRAAFFLFRAGEKARRAYLNEEALEALRRALLRLEEPGATEHIELRARARESMGDVLELVGRHDEAVENFEQALGELPLEARVERGRVLRKAGSSRQIQRRREEALALFDRAVEALGEPPGGAEPEWDAERSAVELGKIMLVYFTSTPEVLAEQIERSSVVIEVRGTPFQRAWFSSMSALLGLRQERYQASRATVAHAREGYEAAQQLETRVETADILFVYAFCLLWAGALDEAQRHLEEILVEAERMGYVTVQSRCVSYLALIGRKRGDVATARRWAERTLEVAAAGGMSEYVAAAEAHLSWAARREGNLEEAAMRARRAFDEGEKMGGAYHVLAWITTWPLLGVRLDEGDLDGALALGRRLLDPERQPAPTPIANALAEAIDAAEAGDRERASDRLADAARLAREPGYL